MKAYEVLTRLQLRRGEDPLPAGAIVELGSKDAERLLKVKAVRPAPTGAKVTAGAAPDGKPKALGDHTVAELKAIAAAESVEIDDRAKKAELVSAIEAKREAPASSDETGGGDGGDGQGSDGGGQDGQDSTTE